jgi:hypothetical protein
MPVHAENDDLTFLDDPGLSYKAKGIMMCILSSRDEPVTITALQERSSCGSHATRTGIQELLDAEYIRRV